MHYTLSVCSSVRPSADHYCSPLKIEGHRSSIVQVHGSLWRMQIAILFLRSGDQRSSFKRFQLMGINHKMVGG